MLGFQNVHGGIRILGAAAYDYWRNVPMHEQDVIIAIQDHYAKQMPPELHSPDGIGIHGQMISVANQLTENRDPKAPIERNTQPKNNAELIHLNTAFNHTLTHIEPFARSAAAVRARFPEFQGTTVADLIIAIRSGNCGVVLEEEDPHEKENGRPVIRNRVDGFASVADLWKHHIVTQAEIAPWLQWLRV